MAHSTVLQDPDDHLFYDVDWTAWLASRNFVVGDILSFSWSIEGTAGGGTITGTADAGAVSRVYVNAVPNKKTCQMVCVIELTNPDGGAAVLQSFRFDIKGTEVT